jgi:hypothetical protein
MSYLTKIIGKHSKITKGKESQINQIMSILRTYEPLVINSKKHPTIKIDFRYWTEQDHKIIISSPNHNLLNNCNIITPFEWDSYNFKKLGKYYDIIHATAIIKNNTDDKRITIQINIYHKSKNKTHITCRVSINIETPYCRSDISVVRYNHNTGDIANYGQINYLPYDNYMYVYKLALSDN